AVAGDADANAFFGPGKGGGAAAGGECSGSAAQADFLSAAGGQVGQGFSLGDGEASAAGGIAEGVDLVTWRAKCIDVAQDIAGLRDRDTEQVIAGLLLGLVQGERACFRGGIFLL